MQRLREEKRSSVAKGKSEDVAAEERSVSRLFYNSYVYAHKIIVFCRIQEAVPLPAANSREDGVPTSSRRIQEPKREAHVESKQRIQPADDRGKGIQLYFTCREMIFYL